MSMVLVMDPRHNYPELNALMASTTYVYGPGDGSTTFNLPNAQGRVLGYHNFPTSYTGESAYTLSASNITSHSHGFDHTHPMSSHTHTATAHGHTQGTHVHSPAPHAHPVATATGHTHTGNYAIAPGGSFGTNVKVGTSPGTPWALMGPAGAPHNHTPSPPSIMTTTNNNSPVTQTDPPTSSIASGTLTTAESSPLTTGFSGSPTRDSFPLDQPRLNVLAVIKVA